MAPLSKTGSHSKSKAAQPFPVVRVLIVLLAIALFPVWLGVLVIIAKLLVG